MSAHSAADLMLVIDAMAEVVAVWGPLKDSSGTVLTASEVIAICRAAVARMRAGASAPELAFMQFESGIVDAILAP